MKKITIFLNNNPIAMFTFKGSFANAEIQAEHKRELFSKKYKVNIQRITYLIR